jgi:hypothetical protein
LADGNIVVASTSGDALAQSGIGRRCVERRRALEVAGVVEADEVAHLVGHGVLEIVERLPAAAQVGVRDQVAQLKWKALTSMSASRMIPDDVLADTDVSASAAGSYDARRSHVALSVSLHQFGRGR